MQKIFRLVLLAALLVCGCSELHAYTDFRVEFDYDSRWVADSLRKDYYEPVFNTATMTRDYTREQYDNTYFGGHSDMFFALRGDIGDLHFIDVKETLLYRHYNDQDSQSRDFSSQRIKELDHQLNVTWGIAVGQHDYFQLDFFNNVVEMPEFDAWNYRSNRAKGVFSHNFSDRTSMNIHGGYEERRYANDGDGDFSEGRVMFEVLTYVPSRYSYRPVANSARGNREYFESFPGAMRAEKAIDYYTDWTTNPRDDDPRAKYIVRRSRGDLYLRFFGEGAVKEHSSLDNRDNQIGLGFEAIYDMADNLRVLLREHNINREYRRQSNVFELNDNNMNNLSLALAYESSQNMTQTFSFYDQRYKFDRADENDYRDNSLVYEVLYSEGRNRASASLGGMQRRYSQPRLWYSDQDEMRFTGAYDYSITSGLLFKLKSEYVDTKYKQFQTFRCSDHKRNTWRLALERSFSRYNSIELAYQQNYERHQTFDENNIEEKSLSLGWLSNF